MPSNTSPSFHEYKCPVTIAKPTAGRQIYKSGSESCFARTKHSDISCLFLRFVALALECYECSNAPGSEVSKCDSDSIGNITCPQFANRCFTMKARMTIGQTTMDLTMRNCTNSMACDPKSEFNRK